MITARKLGKSLGLAAVFGVALFAGVHFMAGHSDAFMFVEQRIRSSQAIKSQVGEINQIRPSLFGSYAHKTVNSDEWVSMTLDVTGMARSIELDVKARKANGTWTLESVKRGDQTIDID